MASLRGTIDTISWAPISYSLTTEVIVSAFLLNHATVTHSHYNGDIILRAFLTEALKT